MKFWIARDLKSKALYLYRDKPVKCEYVFLPKMPQADFKIDKDLFPEVTFENSPVQVEIKLI